MNIQDLFGKMQLLQQQVEEARKKLGELRVEAEAGGGMVRVTASGARQILKIKLDDEVLQDREMMEDLICAAVNKALDQADQLAREEMARATSGLMPNMPGMDLSRFGL
ncbi:MAG: YbaB/EbfC family nucleoid-associated protein [Bacteroidetes bacterium]|nr:YbaB/EbfC family nucleoid-associated protein [Bacteroidota bacterium]